MVTYLDMIPRRVKVAKIRGSLAGRTYLERAWFLILFLLSNSISTKAVYVRLSDD